MHVSDFDFFNIEVVSHHDILKTGAELNKVNVFTIVKLQDFVDESRVQIELIHNGITTGKHKSPLHPKGLAIDVAVINVPKIYEPWKCAIKHFGGVGVYWNGACYSMHLDLRPRGAYWSGAKNGKGEWVYSGIFSDPKELSVK